MSGRQKQDIVKHVVKLLDVSPDDIVLEIGFGPGMGIHCIQDIIGDCGLVIGIDPSEIMLDMAGKRNSNAIKNRKVRLLHGKVEKMPFPNEYFNKVLAMNSMQLWPDKIVGLREILRVLKPGGKLVLSFDGPARKEIIGKILRTKLEETYFTEIDEFNNESTIYASATK
jgi:ubiquinone/menaquinone biosynthesis C-methylase UbiE